MPDFEFRPGDHSYWLDGQRLPSVTEVLQATGILPDYKYLDPWYAERGSALHEAIGLALTGELDEDSVDERIQVYLERALWAVEQLGGNVIDVETPLYHPTDLYAGTRDLLLEMPHGGTVVDFKTTSWEPGHSVQVAAYRDLDLAVALNRCKWGYVVGLGTMPPTIQPVPPADLYREHNTFQAALANYRWRQRHNPRSLA